MRSSIRENSNSSQEVKLQVKFPKNTLRLYTLINRHSTAIMPMNIHNRQSKKYRQVRFESNEKRLETLFTHVTYLTLGTLSNDDDDGSENVAKKMNLRSFKLNHLYLDPINMSNVGDFSWS